MTNQQADPTKAANLAQEIVKILIKEESETRQRAIQAALLLLGEVPSKSVQAMDNTDSSGSDLATFFTRDEKLKPSDYAQLCAAFHFSKYGSTSFSLEELRTIASEAGVVLPDRLDMTLTNAAKDGKKLFQSGGRGAYKPTAAAGLVFKERWNVKPGKNTKNMSTVKE